MNRQLFRNEDISRNKAEALAERYGCEFIPSYYSHGMIDHGRNDWLMVCVDNNAGRKSVLDSCDRFKCSAIFASNEQFSAEAAVYFSKWKETRLDPRVYAKEILEDDGHDPRAGAIGCTGLAQIQTPQLVTSNMAAAALAGGLFTLWSIQAKKLAKEVIPMLPFRRVINLSKMEEFKVGQL